MRRYFPLALCLFTSSCGYIGEPLPPALNIPVTITDLAAVERGARIIVQFNVPKLTTEGVALKKPPRLELRIGEGGGEFNADGWASRAKTMEVTSDQTGHVWFETPVEPWVGKEVILGVRAYGPTERPGSWSNYAILNVAPPLDPPASVRPEATAEGVRVTWSGAGTSFRIFRRAGKEENLSLAATAEAPPWTDTATEYGKPYSYAVQAVQNGAESELSQTVTITPEDRFPPAAPSGLHAIVGTGSIELVWDRNTEPDLAAYRIYRAVESGKLQPISETQEQPSYSDKTVEAGKKYRYAVSAIDRAGNESGLSEVAEIAAP